MRRRDQEFIKSLLPQQSSEVRRCRKGSRAAWLQTLAAGSQGGKREAEEPGRAGTREGRLAAISHAKSGPQPRALYFGDTIIQVCVCVHARVYFTLSRLAPEALRAAGSNSLTTVWPNLLPSRTQRFGRPAVELGLVKERACLGRGKTGPDSENHSRF